MIYKLRPITKQYIWGGRKLIDGYGKTTTDSGIAESWELSIRDDGQSTVAEGKSEGLPLSQLLTDSEFGAKCSKFSYFPTLIKLIDARENLSVQVHPSDDYALKNEGQFGKTEMWYILDADKDAVIYLGLNKNLTKEQLKEAIANNSLIDCLNAVKVERGQRYFVPSGTLHAIGAGVTLYEVQQNSNLTYRVYDYDRRDSQGNPRQLHVDKALAVVNLNKFTVPPQPSFLDPIPTDLLSQTLKNPSSDSLLPDDFRQKSVLLGKCDYFSAYFCKNSVKIINPDSFVALTVIDGELDYLNDCRHGQSSTAVKGDTLFITAGSDCVFHGKGEYIITTLE